MPRIADHNDDYDDDYHDDNHYDDYHYDDNDSGHHHHPKISKSEFRLKPQPKPPQLQQPRPKQPRRRLLSRFCFFIFFIVDVEFLVLMTQQLLSRFVGIDCKC